MGCIKVSIDFFFPLYTRINFTVRPGGDKLLTPQAEKMRF